MVPLEWVFSLLFCNCLVRAALRLGDFVCSAVWCYLCRLSFVGNLWVCILVCGFLERAALYAYRSCCVY